MLPQLRTDRRRRALLLRHWLAVLLLSGGLALRVLTQLAYHPAILYIDSLKYLYNAWTGANPVGYKVPLKIILSVGDLGTVTAVQHLLGLLMAVLLYVLLQRRGVSRWLAAVAMAPVLLDAYQLEAEATTMPDVMFEAFIVAALAVLLWQPSASWLAAAATGLILGIGVTVREVGLILPVYIPEVTLKHSRLAARTGRPPDEPALPPARTG